MSQEVKSVKSLTELVLGLTIVESEGTQYLGEVKEVENGVEISNAVKVGGSLKETVQNWIAANNLNELEAISLKGAGISYTTKSFNEKQKMEVTSIVTKAEYDIKYAVPTLQNKAMRGEF